MNVGMNYATEPNSLETLNYTTTTKKSQICSNCPILLILSVLLSYQKL